MTGHYGLGEKLPTEQEICAHYGVSRTVVREAVAGLRAAGLVTSRRGSGVFVAANGEAKPMPLQLKNTESLPEVIDVLELRAPVEIEAARLAARRASPRQVEEIRRCHAAFESALLKGQETRMADFVFHQAIAAATNNNAFCTFLEQLGRQTIPRSKLEIASDNGAYASYLEQLLAEHAEIVAGIEQQDPDAAMRAMQKHLNGSLSRYMEISRTLTS